MNTRRPDPNQPPADVPISYSPAAAEPPWEKAADELAPPTEGLRYSGDTFRAQRIAIVKRACESHAAALARERDALRSTRDECERQFQEKIAEIGVMIDKLAACKEALELARPIVKHRLCDGNIPERGYYAALEALDKIEAALK